MADIPVEVWQLARDEDGQDVVLLRDRPGRVLPIVIDICQAAAMWVVLSPERAKPYIRRPWSHDLLQAMLERLGARLERVVIDGFVNDAYLATLHLIFRDEERLLDARPSDAIALLLRMPAPLFVNDEVMEEHAFAMNGEADDDEDDAPDSGEGHV
jgi:bifunctional DNase/RNase